MIDQKAYARLRREVATCTTCPLHETRQKVAVDRGTVGAKLAIIGEAPGEREDEEGSCFIGPAGEELDRLLRKARIPSRDYIIFNILKCRPPGNRFPGDSGSAVDGRCVHTCIEKWFDLQFRILAPKVVVLVGRRALEWTLYRKFQDCPPMGVAAGKWFLSGEYPGVDFFAMYHTSYLLRTEQHEPELHADALAAAQKTLRAASDALTGQKPRGKPIVLHGAKPPEAKQGYLFH